MPVNQSSWGKRQPRRLNLKLNGVHSEHVQDTGLVNGSVYHDCITCADGPRTILPLQVDTHNSIQPKKRVNGYSNHGFWSKRTEMSDVSKKQDKNSLGYSRAEQPQSNGSVSVNLDRDLGKHSLSNAVYNKKPAVLEPETKAKSQRKKKKPWHYKRKKVYFSKNLELQAPEDWENEIEEVKARNWEEISFGPQPYGPEDVVNFSLRDLSLERTKPPLWQLASTNYLPAARHPKPIDWHRYKPPSEPGQFSDAED